MCDDLDWILVDGLLVRCVIGVTADERREKQDVVIDLELGHDSRPAGDSDDLADALDYRALKKRVYAVVETSAFCLVEAMAARIADLCLEEPRVAVARVTVHKPSALRFARSVGIRITRRRQ